MPDDSAVLLQMTQLLSHTLSFPRLYFRTRLLVPWHHPPFKVHCPNAFAPSPLLQDLPDTNTNCSPYTQSYAFFWHSWGQVWGWELQAPGLHSHSEQGWILTFDVSHNVLFRSLCREWYWFLCPALFPFILHLHCGVIAGYCWVMGVMIGELSDCPAVGVLQGGGVLMKGQCRWSVIVRNL